MDTERINRIKDKLQHLSELDSEHSIFGSETHKYELNPPKTEGELQTFEQKHQIRLPIEYRTFLKEVGNGGAGPYYGLEPLEHGRFTDLDSRNEDWLIDLSAPFPHTERWNMDFGPVPEEDTPEEQEYWRKRDEEYFDDKWIKGMLRVSNFGCGVSMNLIVNGTEFGNIWVDDRGNDQGIYPDPYFEVDHRLNFLDWYELWLDRSLKEVTAGNNQ